MDTAEPEHRHRTVPAAPQSAPHSERPAAQHPLLELQRQAGNAAVAGLVAVQRHSLDPEEEAGA
ncbi:Cgref1; cell growth regulator with EF hand domain 1 [Cellulomonas flavigena DSM 20109]|uniref:Cgref1 cell growth regulator with EF hand domain 1 n=1 Tax=Cellulomonas flavigena (strain ATCC 482 / DSM 20109 / BCRC 11376 / JCM 18109 / NBRC 3775 / NCIMB 8073 / NRS 134) TaxID=446466 RepID=D5UG36_CELFN|nr:hypothetical protein [Cellulomonas flavigena]ADG75059.1 Cgref1; cell growth regulator with EF hand domain 1 [Cellulomonas flavigena DSM 20109]